MTPVRLCFMRPCTCLAPGCASSRPGWGGGNGRPTMVNAPV